jgi:hypothetical protein
MNLVYGFLQTAAGRLRLFLWLVAIHTFIVGVLLVVIPPDLMSIFGFSVIREGFFKVQGGVFHFVILYAYVKAALSLINNHNMVEMAIYAKLLATLFLGLYFIYDPILTVGLSGLGDFFMGLILWYLYRDYLRELAYA